MFNNIIYFIIVLLIFNISFPDSKAENSLSYTLMMLFLGWLIFAGYCKVGFKRLLERSKGDILNGSMSGEYHRLVLRLSVLAIFLFALDVYLFQLKYWLQLIPGFKQFSTFQGVIALMLFFFYMCTIWHFSHSTYEAVFQTAIPRRVFIASNIRLNIPILFPWLALSFVYDLISISPWGGPESFFNKPGGQMFFFASFLVVLMVFMPRFIQYWWGCRPFEPSEKIRALDAFLREKGFRYRNLLTWPIFQGRMMTAGIMGIVPRYRYILITDALVEVLSIEELKAVLSHEMGHAKYRHLLFYVVFFIGYMILSLGLFDLFFYFIAAQPMFINTLATGESNAADMFYLTLSFPILVTMFVYFRYIMGFFMRNFERQADLYSAVTMGGPGPTISSLEKIAFLGGKIRDLPSWHHFSIKERVDCLGRMMRDPGLVKRHNRFVGVSFAVYIICIIGLGYFLNFGSVKQDLTYNLAGKILNQQILKDPDNIPLLRNLAVVYHEAEEYRKAMKIYERIISLDNEQSTALNNLAWLLATAGDKELRDEKRALILAKKAVEITRSSTFLDTLAEAYYANGYVHMAVKTIKEAISLAKRNRGYYEGQLKKFMKGIERG